MINPIKINDKILYTRVDILFIFNDNKFHKAKCKDIYGGNGFTKDSLTLFEFGWPSVR